MILVFILMHLALPNVSDHSGSLPSTYVPAVSTRTQDISVPITRSKRMTKASSYLSEYHCNLVSYNSPIEPPPVYCFSSLTSSSPVHRHFTLCPRFFLTKNLHPHTNHISSLTLLKLNQSLFVKP